MNQSGGMDSHVGITLPQQRKPGFQSIQPSLLPSSMGRGSAQGQGQGQGQTQGPGLGLPFLSFDLSSAQAPSSSTTTSSSSYYGHMAPPGPLRSNGSGFFEEEPPLLEELGINTSHIIRKTLAILNPIKLNGDIHEDGDLSGPLLIFMLFGTFQLLAGKVQFGVILGWLTVASFFLYFVFNMLVGMNGGGLDLYRCSSFIGYCLIPMVIFSAISLFLPRGGPTSFVAACLAVIWCTRACTSLLVVVTPHAGEHRSLVGYVCGLIYTSFSLLVLF